MLPLLALAVLQQEGRVTKSTTLGGVFGPTSVLIQTPSERLADPKRSPQKFGEPPMPWEFDWTVAGYTQDESGNYQLRFDLYSQESTQTSPRPENVVRTLMRLFHYNVDRMRLEHATEFNRIVQVYLCYGGVPGGEQRFDVDHQFGSKKVDTIYLYDLRSLTNPVETVREVAHEYGHATLPAVGGFTEPEDWANGMLGEKLYLPYLARSLRAGALTSDDALGATAEGLEAWSKTNVDPLIVAAATKGPDAKALAGKSKTSMDAFLGLALWTSKLFDEKASFDEKRILTKALLIAGTDAKGFPEAVVTATENRDLTTLNVPATLLAKPIWVPVGDGKILGAKTLEKRDGWARIQPRGEKISLSRPKRP